MLPIINFDELTELQAPTVTLDEALSELNRENKMRRSCYDRWGKNQPQKIGAYKRQFTRTAAIQLVLATLSPDEFRRRLLAATIAQTKMF